MFEAIKQKLSPNVPPVEPELKDWYNKWEQSTEKDRKGNDIAIYKFTVPAKTKNDQPQIIKKTIYEFNVSFYKAQIDHVNAKIEPVKAEINKYEVEIKNIENQIKRQEEKRESKTDRVIEAQKNYKLMQEEYYRKLRKGLFEYGDQEEEALREQLEAMAKKMPKTNPSEIVYAGKFIDIDDPKKGEQDYKDVRVLIKKYNDKISNLKDKLKPLESRLEANNYYYKKSDQDLNQYNAYLNK